MKKYYFIIAFFFLAISVQGQQGLWTTDSTGTAPFIPLSDVPREILRLYDQYSYYVDYTGYSKAGFINAFGSHWNWINNYNTKTAAAMRVPTEDGSAVMVIILDKNNANMIFFINVGGGAIATTASHRARFEHWIRSFL